MLAIPVLRSRVAPVLNWCSRIQIFPEEPCQEGWGKELFFFNCEQNKYSGLLQKMIILS